MGEVKVLTAHQTLLLEMLKDFDAVCRKHHISYQLFAGTALGAVRHHGFIPWDDDVDVILMRSEYDRLLTEAAGDFDPERYYVQRENSAHWPMQFSKLRRNHTACIEKYHPKDPLVHQGVYIDIFPCDNLSDRPLMRRLQFAASKAIIAKALYARGYETDSAAKKVFMPVAYWLGAKLFKRPMKETFDVFTPCMIFTVMCARINCILSGCCTGLIIPGTQLRCPTRELELVYYIVMLILLIPRVKKDENPGTCYPLYMASYGAFRFVIEFFRTSSSGMLFHLSHIWAALAFAAGLSVYIEVNNRNHRVKKGKKVGRK